MSVFNVALIGCGGFVRHTHLANLNRHARFQIHAAVDVNPDAAQHVAEAGGAAYWTDNADRAISDPAVDVVFIATPHHNHADLTIRAARAGKHIYCEKPMGLTEAECQAVAAAVRESGVKYVLGYNRALAPFSLQARDLLASLDAPMLICYRFADWNPYGTSWMIDEKLSGGRVIGEGCHALDLLCRFVGQDPVRLYAEGGNLAAPSPTGAPDSAAITLGFPNGSAAVLYLSSVGNNAYPKEEIQITCNNHTVVIYGFERMAVYAPDGEKSFSLPAVDKGHWALLDEAASVFAGEAEPSVGVAEGLRGSRLTFAAVASIRAHRLHTL
ncbi:MAG: hypothetical protein Kow00120_14170 [Anaerolineae bacterium]